MSTADAVLHYTNCCTNNLETFAVPAVLLEASILLANIFVCLFKVYDLWWIFGCICLCLYEFVLFSQMGWRLGLQAATGLLLSAFFLGTFYRSASLYHPQRRAILHLKTQRKKVSLLSFLFISKLLQSLYSPVFYYEITVDRAGHILCESNEFTWQVEMKLNELCWVWTAKLEIGAYYTNLKLLNNLQKNLKGPKIKFLALFNSEINLDIFWQKLFVVKI